jgi:glycosyltransferase involved in cell wall biosynthesis
MIVGTPIVASADGGNSEIIIDGETGILVTPDDAAAFADGVAAILKSQSLGRKLADAAPRQARQRFSDETHSRTIVGVYKSIARPARVAVD